MTAATLSRERQETRGMLGAITAWPEVADVVRTYVRTHVRTNERTNVRFVRFSRQRVRRTPTVRCGAAATERAPRVPTRRRRSA